MSREVTWIKPWGERFEFYFHWIASGDWATRYLCMLLAYRTCGCFLGSNQASAISGIGCREKREWARHELLLPSKAKTKPTPFRHKMLWCVHVFWCQQFEVSICRATVCAQMSTFLQARRGAEGWDYFKMTTNPPKAARALSASLSKLRFNFFPF
jgi:hypothetical protein